MDLEVIDPCIEIGKQGASEPMTCKAVDLRKWGTNLISSTMTRSVARDQQILESISVGRKKIIRQ